MRLEKKAAKRVRKTKKRRLVSTTDQPARSKETRPLAPSRAETPAGKAIASRASRPHSSGQEETVWIPPILLEGDAVAAPIGSGPGERFALGPESLPSHWSDALETDDLPESYGTGQLLLLARDPHWLYVAWDLTSEQQRLCMARSTDGHLIVRVYLNSLEEPPVEEVRVQPESFSTFIRVARGGARYLAELGCRDQSGEWTRLAVSQVVVTPWEGVSEDTSVQFATIPPAVKLEEFLELITTLVAEKVPITEAIQQLRSSGDTLLLRTSADLTPRRWTSAEAKALAEAVGMDTSLGTGMGSLEMAEMVRQRGQEWVDQPAVLPPPAVRQIEEQAGAVGAVASPVEAFAPPERKGPFWFNINAELVVYGATEPDAQVGIGSRRIQLRPDGTFSFRFALPDGNYDLKVLAVSADGQDARLAELRFARDTHYTGDVGVHPQDPSLKIPAAANVS